MGEMWVEFSPSVQKSPGPEQQVYLSSAHASLPPLPVNPTWCPCVPDHFRSNHVVPMRP